MSRHWKHLPISSRPLLLVTILSGGALRYIWGVFVNRNLLKTDLTTPLDTFPTLASIDPPTPLGWNVRIEPLCLCHCHQVPTPLLSRSSPFCPGNRHPSIDSMEGHPVYGSLPEDSEVNDISRCQQMGCCCVPC